MNTLIGDQSEQSDGKMWAICISANDIAVTRSRPVPHVTVPIMTLFFFRELYEENRNYSFNSSISIFWLV